MKKKSFLLKLGVSMFALFLLTACNSETNTDQQEDTNMEENTEESADDSTEEEAEG